jgi:hypothetical protein
MNPNIYHASRRTEVGMKESRKFLCKALWREETKLDIVSTCDAMRLKNRFLGRKHEAFFLSFLLQDIHPYAHIEWHDDMGYKKCRFT